MTSQKIISKIIPIANIQYFILPKRLVCTQTITNAVVRQERCRLYVNEKQKQFLNIKRNEKIRVEHMGLPEDVTLEMEKGISTPFNCALRSHYNITEFLMTPPVVALVNNVPWDIHRPLVEDCELRFLYLNREENPLAKRTFWRSCSFILGHILERSFKDAFYIELCGFPPPSINSGSFIQDVDFKFPSHRITKADLSVLSRNGSKLYHYDYRFERLDVDATVARRMFKDNRFKTDQIPSIAAQSESGNLVTLYRMDDHIDISQGPMMSTTRLIGRYNIVAVHDIESFDFGPLKRIQGIAYPSSLGFKKHQSSYEYMLKKATKLNPAPAPYLINRNFSSDLDSSGPQ